MKKVAVWSLLVVNWALVVGFWYWNTAHHPFGNLLLLDVASRLLAVGRLAGLLAVTGVLLQLLLIGRIRWIEQSYGLDRLSRLHHYNAFVVVLLLFSHVVCLTISYSLQREVGWGAQIATFFRNWEDLPSAMIAFALFVGLSAMALVIVKRRLKYECWYGAHLLLYAAILLAFGHQLEGGGDFTENRWLSAYWYALYGFVLINLLSYRSGLPLFSIWRYRLTVDRVVAETGEVTSIYITGRNLEKLAIHAGQFMILRFLARGYWTEAHPFSLSCRPNGNYLRVSIKHLGDFTRRVSQLRPGTPVIMDGPHGIFTARQCHRDEVLLIAGGIGITPLRGLAEEFLDAGKDVVLLYTNRVRAGIALADELRQLGAAGRWRMHHILSHDPDWSGEKGYLDAERLQRLVPDFRVREIYLCGPPAMMRQLLKILRVSGVPEKSLHHERFAL
ncbi:MAG: ferredoxin reductase family protein [bacterium]